jgi:hypothetical protein
VYNQLTAGSLSQSQSICNSNVPSEINGTLPTGGSGSYSYAWQSSPDGNTWKTLPYTSGQNYSPPALTVTTYYERIVTTGDNCGSVTSSPVIITVYPLFNAGGITDASQTVCNGSTPAQLTGNNATGGDGTYTYTWESSTNGSTWFDVSNPNSVSYQPGILSQTTYFRRLASSGSGCGSSTSSIDTINVRGTLNAGSISTSKDTICNGSIPSLITGTAASGGIGTLAYSWSSSPDGKTWNTIPGQTGQNYQAGNIYTTMYYERQVSCACGSEVSNIVTFNVLSPVTVPTVVYDSIYCFGTNVSLNVSNAGNFSTYWSNSVGVSISSGNSLVLPKINNSRVVYVKFLTTSNCFSDSLHIPIHVQQVTADFTTVETDVAVGSNVQFVGTYQNASSYLWNFSEGVTSTLASPWHIFNIAGEKTIQVIAYSAQNCTDTVTKINFITVGPSTGVNVAKEEDSFLVYPNPVSSILTVQSQNTISLKLFNSAGQVLFEKNAINGDTSIDMFNYPSGVYILNVQTGVKLTVVKIIKL